MTNDILFTPLRFRNLTVKNRIFRSNIAGRFDHYDGHGTQARINWEVKFALFEIVSVTPLLIRIVCHPAPAPAGPNAVDIDNFAFAPAELTVPAGTTVTWTLAARPVLVVKNS